MSSTMEMLKIQEAYENSLRDTQHKATFIIDNPKDKKESVPEEFDGGEVVDTYRKCKIVKHKVGQSWYKKGDGEKVLMEPLPFTPYTPDGEPIYDCASVKEAREAIDFWYDDEERHDAEVDSAIEYGMSPSSQYL